MSSYRQFSLLCERAAFLTLLYDNLLSKLDLFLRPLLSYLRGATPRLYLRCFHDASTKRRLTRKLRAERYANGYKHVENQDHQKNG